LRFQMLMEARNNVGGVPKSVLSERFHSLEPRLVADAITRKRFRADEKLELPERQGRYEIQFLAVQIGAMVKAESASEITMVIPPIRLRNVLKRFSKNYSQLIDVLTNDVKLLDRYKSRHIGVKGVALELFTQYSRVAKLIEAGHVPAHEALPELKEANLDILLFWDVTKPLPQLAVEFQPTAPAKTEDWHKVNAPQFVRQVLAPLLENDMGGFRVVAIPNMARTADVWLVIVGPKPEGPGQRAVWLQAYQMKNYDSDNYVDAQEEMNKSIRFLKSLKEVPAVNNLAVKAGFLLVGGKVKKDVPVSDVELAIAGHVSPSMIRAEEPWAMRIWFKA